MSNFEFLDLIEKRTNDNNNVILTNTTIDPNNLTAETEHTYNVIFMTKIVASLFIAGITLFFGFLPLFWYLKIFKFNP
jgi:hypothetical protein